MNILEVIGAVRLAGGTLATIGGDLLVESPCELEPMLLEEIVAHKPELLRLLRPSATYADLSAHEERDAIVSESVSQDVSFEPPSRCGRCRLVTDTPWQSPLLGAVTFPAGLEGLVVGDLEDEIADPIDRLAVRWILEADRRAGKNTIAMLIDGKPRVLDAAAVQFVDEEQIPSE